MHIETLTGGIGVGADDVGLVHDRLGVVALEARQPDHQLDVEAQGLAVGAWAESELVRNRALVSDMSRRLSAGALQRPRECRGGYSGESHLNHGWTARNKKKNTIC